MLVNNQRPLANPSKGQMRVKCGRLQLPGYGGTPCQQYALAIVMVTESYTNSTRDGSMLSNGASSIKRRPQMSPIRASEN